MKIVVLSILALIVLGACGDDNEGGQHCQTPETTCLAGMTYKLGSDCVCVKDGKQTTGQIVP